MVRHLARGILEVVGGLARSIGRLPDRICGGILPVLEASVGHRDSGLSTVGAPPGPGREADEHKDRKAAKHGHSGGAAGEARDTEVGALPAPCR